MYLFNSPLLTMFSFLLFEILTAKNIGKKKRKKQQQLDRAFDFLFADHDRLYAGEKKIHRK